MQSNKLKSYLGFSIKSGEIVFGFDNLLTTKKRIKLVVCDKLVNDKTMKKLILLCEYKKWALIQIDNLGELIARENCKIMALLNKSLSSAIINENVNIILRGDF